MPSSPADSTPAQASVCRHCGASESVHEPLLGTCQDCKGIFDAADGPPAQAPTPDGPDTTMRNARGEWVSAIPFPLFAELGHRCRCGKFFWTFEGYQGHYAFRHILLGE